MAFVDDHQVDVSQLLRLGAHRLYASKRDRLPQVLAANARAVDPHWRTWPVLAQLLSVLLDQLLHMGQHQDTGLGPVLQGILAQRGHNVRLA